MRAFFSIVILFSLQATFTTAIRVFSNPVIPGKNLPDPGAVFYDGFYYVANTGGWGSGKFPIHKSKDLQNWDYVADIFPDDHLPKWTDKKSDFWAPEIHIINGKFRAVFASTEASSGRLCVGMAYSDKIEGPYADIGEPLIKNNTVGSIDPSILSLSNDTHYLIWKDDGNGNNPKLPTWIKAQLLGPEGLHVSGEVYYLLKNTLPWEGAVTEAPWIIQQNNYYYLFYSGNSYCDPYAVGVARSTNPLGPYEKFGDPILKSNTKWTGPGHCSVLPVNGQNDTWVMIYHSWKEGQVCGTGDERHLMVDYVYWSNDWPYMKHSSPSSTSILDIYEALLSN